MYNIHDSRPEGFLHDENSNGCYMQVTIGWRKENELGVNGNTIPWKKKKNIWIQIRESGLG